MALVFRDRVTDTTTTTGTGTVTLASAPPASYQAFSAVGNGNTCYYTIVDRTTGAWECGIGTYSSTGPTLARTTVHANSLGTTALISFGAGTKDVGLMASATFLASLAALLLPQFTSTIGVGTAASASGSGVSFPATQAPSTDPNTLDDYEEGTWTPTVTSASGTLTSASGAGTYTKVGRLVTATIVATITTNGTGGAAILATLPFTNNATRDYFGAGRETSSTGTMLQGAIDAGGSTVLITKYDNTYPGFSGAALKITISYSV